MVAERFFGFELERRQWMGLVLTSAGLAMLAVTGEARSGQDTADYAIATMLVFEAVLAAVGVALIVSCNRRQTGGRTTDSCSASRPDSCSPAPTWR